MQHALWWQLLGGRQGMLQIATESSCHQGQDGAEVQYSTVQYIINSAGFRTAAVSALWLHYAPLCWTQGRCTNMA
jgi:hypothetical protein